MFLGDPLPPSEVVVEPGIPTVLFVLCLNGANGFAVFLSPGCIAELLGATPMGIS